MKHDYTVSEVKIIQSQKTVIHREKKNRVFLTVTMIVGSMHNSSEQKSKYLTFQFNAIIRISS